MSYLFRSAGRLWWILAAIMPAVLLSIGFASAQTPTLPPSPAPPSAQPIDPIRETIHTLTDHIPDQYIVVFNPTSGRSAQLRHTTRRQIEQAGGQVNREYTTIFNGLAITLPSEKAVAELAADPNVAYIAPNQQFHVLESPQENPTWGLDRIDQATLPLDNRYAYAGDGSGVHAFIIDTGILSTHEAFTGRIGVGYDFYNDDDEPQDDHWHGTHVAGTVGGTQYGVAKDVTLHAAKVCSGSGSCPQDVILSAFEWVINRPERPAVINMSLGGAFDQATNDAIAAAVEAGVVVVVAAGNSKADACDSTPGSAAEAIVVGASDDSDALALFTNYGSCIDLFAPGVDIVSASNLGNTLTRTASGTSMASPHVAGAIAIYLEAGYSAEAATQALLDNTISGQLTGLIADSPDKLLYQQVTPFRLMPTPAMQASCAPSGLADISLAATVDEVYPFTGDVVLGAEGAPATVHFADNPLTTFPTTTTLTMTGVTTGDHTFYITASSTTTPSLITTQTVRQHVAQAVPAMPPQITPPNSETDVSRAPILSWSSVDETISYTIEVGLDNILSNIVHSTTTTALSTTVSGLLPNTLYYWQVTAHNGCGPTSSHIHHFWTRDSRLYVNTNASGAATGLSWADAYLDLAAALDEAIDGDTVWVASGIYRPTIASGSRDASFVVADGVAVYGGFDGGETLLTQRDTDPASNNTILSGDLNANDSGSNHLDDNSYSVVQFELFAKSDTVLDGFTITGGNADGTGNLAQPNTGGGGIFLSYGTPKLHNLILTGNRAAQAGAGLTTYGSPDLNNVLFSSNIISDSGYEKELYGGGMFSYYGSPTLRDVIFRDNQVIAVGSESIASAGGFIQVLGSASLMNVTFDDNMIYATSGITGSATAMGGAFRNIAAGATLVNVQFVGNSAESSDQYSQTAAAHGGAMHSSHEYATLTNVIFSGNRITATGHVTQTAHGGAIYNAGQMRVTNSTLYANSSSDTGGGVYNDTGSTFDAINSIFWHNSDTDGSDTSAQVHDASAVSAISYSVLEGGWGAPGILDTDPLFVDEDGADNLVGTIDDDFRGQYNAPILNVGSNGALPTDALDIDQDGDSGETLPLDWTQQVRIANLQVDYGAVETQIASAQVTPVSSGYISYTSIEGVGFSADIPADAVTQTVDFVYTWQQAVETIPAGLEFYGQAFTLDAFIGGVRQDDFAFEEPITVTIRYADSASEALETLIRLYYYDEGLGAWVDAAQSCAPVSTYEHDLVNNQFTVAVCHLTEFGVFWPTSPLAVTEVGMGADAAMIPTGITLLWGGLMWFTIVTLWRRRKPTF